MILNSYNNILVLAPHTDDGELGLGGTISKLIELGKKVTYVAFSTAQQSVPEGFPKDIQYGDMSNDTLNEKDRCLSCAGCRDCKMCLTSCPRGAIERVEFQNADGTTAFAYISDEKKCIGCGICAGVCPCGIWTMKSQLEG